jgi:hypothetical protein
MRFFVLLRFSSYYFQKNTHLLFQPVFGNPPKGRQTIGQLLGFLTNPDSTEPIRILACRALTNSANHEFGRQMLLSEIAAFCHAISKQLCSPKPALQVLMFFTIGNKLMEIIYFE